MNAKFRPLSFSHGTLIQTSNVFVDQKGNMSEEVLPCFLDLARGRGRWTYRRFVCLMGPQPLDTLREYDSPLVGVAAVPHITHMQFFFIPSIISERVMSFPVDQLKLHRRG